MAPIIASGDDANGVVKPKTESQPSCAYVTFLAGNGDYVKGVVGLAKGLRKAKSKYPLVVAMLPEVPADDRKILVDQGCILREIEPVDPPENQIEFDMSCYVINYSKLRIWEFVKYSKMIYLGGDSQVLDNIDDLFDLPNGGFYAVMDCFCDKRWSHTPQFNFGYCQQCPDKVQWPDHVDPKPALYFNAGMFVYEPNVNTYRDLLITLKVTPPTPFAEQDFLNMYFKDIYKPIPNVYNLVLDMLWRHPENVELDKVKVVRYCAAGSKPWRYTGKQENMERDDIKMLVKKWWEIYDDKSLDYKNIVAIDEAVKRTKWDLEITIISVKDLKVEAHNVLLVASVRGCKSKDKQKESLSPSPKKGSTHPPWFGAKCRFTVTAVDTVKFKFEKKPFSSRVLGEVDVPVKDLLESVKDLLAKGRGADIKPKVLTLEVRSSARQTKGETMAILEFSYEWPSVEGTVTDRAAGKALPGMKILERVVTSVAGNFIVDGIGKLAESVGLP